MSREVEAEARIRGGLPVMVYGIVYGAEADVGCDESAEITDICWLSGKLIPDHMWKALSRDDLAACEDALLGDIGGFGSDWRYTMRRDDAAIRSTYGMGAMA